MIARARGRHLGWVLVWLRDLRIKAEYEPDQVHYEEAALAAERARVILHVMLGDT